MPKRSASVLALHRVQTLRTHVIFSIMQCCIYTASGELELARDGELSVAILKQPTSVVSLPGSNELVVVDSGHDRLVAVSPSGQFLRVIGGLSNPVGAAWHSQRRGVQLLVGEQGSSRLSRLSYPTGEVLGSLGRRPELRSPIAVLRAAGRILVSDVCYEKLGDECIGRVLIYDKNLDHLLTIDSGALPNGSRLHPHGLAVLPSSTSAGRRAGRLYIADADSSCLWLFTLEGRLLRRVGTRGTGPMQFIHPRGLMVLPVGSPPADPYLVVAERERVQVLRVGPSSEGEPERSLQRIEYPGSGLLGLCASLDGSRVYVADVSRDRVVVLRRVDAST